MESIVSFAFTSEFDPLYQQILKKWKTDKNTKINPNSLLHNQLISRFMNSDSRHAQHIKNFIVVKHD